MTNHTPTPGPIVEHHGLLLRASEATDGLLNTDWAATPLGPVESWPPTLRVAVQLCLNSRFPVTLCWGRELTVIYNDGYIPIMGRNKHPGAFGQPALEVYAEIDEFLRPLTTSVMEQGETVWQEDQHIPIARHGEPQEGYYTFCYSPVRDPDGRIQGLISIATDTTDHVVRRRRTAAGRTAVAHGPVRLRTLHPVPHRATHRGIGERHHGLRQGGTVHPGRRSHDAHHIRASAGIRAAARRREPDSPHTRAGRRLDRA
ncbi:MAG: PAS domain-containing protein [Gammaproteobacteria bacterium]|nr:PAS domain-containing protein [Gammaproteobacteria bacterium]